MKTVILLQGISGSGKSTWAEKTKSEMNALGFETVIVSVDHFFVQNGEYLFSPTKLSDAHSACFRKFVAAVHDPFCSLIIVDNSSVTKEQLAPYIVYARAFCEKPNIRIISFEVSAKIAANRNIHEISEETILEQLAKLNACDGGWPIDWPTIEKSFGY
jgi:tRNA uridine 5-carbamoylmethylation protein Kti12